MAYTNHFWKQIQQQPRKSTLSDMYRVVRENQNVALFSQEIADPSIPPDGPSSSAKMIGIASKEYADRIERETQLNPVAGADGKQEDVLANIIKEKVGISHPRFIKEVKSSLKSILLDSGYEHVGALMRYILSNNGLFTLFESNEYNAITKAISNIPKEYASGLVQNMFKSIYNNTTQFGNTNIGPGELFLAMFSDAKVSNNSKEDGKSGNKSGDLIVDNQVVEVKSTRGRFGGDRYCLQAFQNTQKALQGIYKAGKSLDKDRRHGVEKLLLELKHIKEDNRIKAEEKIPKFIEYYTNFINSLHRQNRGSFQTVLDKFKNGVESTTGEPFTFTTLVNANYVPSKRVSAGLSVYELLYNSIRSLIKGRENNAEVEGLKFDSRLDNILSNAFDSISEGNPNISIDMLVDVITFVNNYEPNNMKKRTGYDVKQDLKQTIGSNVSEILSMSVSEIEILVGAMHLSSYSNYTEFNKLILINKETGGLISTDVPKTISAAIDFLSNPNIKIEASVDNPEGKTPIGFSVLISYLK